MRIAMSIDYTQEPRAQIDAIADLEDAGLDAVWVPEAWGYDAPSTLGFLAARTRRMTLAAGVLPVHTRTASLIAQTAAGLDALSGGRFELGLGTSGPQVIEGFHGVPFTHPRDRLRDTVGVCRLLWSGSASRYPGAQLTLPLPPGRGTGLGRPLRLLAPAGVRRIPIHLAVMRPGMVELAAEIADGWYPLFFVPGAADGLWAEALARGGARRAAELGPLRITTSFACAIGDEGGVAPLRDGMRADIARYVGGMGPRGRNFYTEVIAGLGWLEAAGEIQARYLAGDRAGAAQAIPEDMLDALTLCGSAARIAARLGALHAAGVRTLVVRPLGPDPAAAIAGLRGIIAAHAWDA